MHGRPSFKSKIAHILPQGDLELKWSLYQARRSFHRHELGMSWPSETRGIVAVVGRLVVEVYRVACVLDADAMVFAFLVGVSTGHYLACVVQSSNSREGYVDIVAAVHGEKKN